MKNDTIILNMLLNTVNTIFSRAERTTCVFLYRQYTIDMFDELLYGMLKLVNIKLSEHTIEHKYERELKRIELIIRLISGNGVTCDKSYDIIYSLV